MRGVMIWRLELYPFCGAMPLDIEVVDHRADEPGEPGPCDRRWLIVVQAAGQEAKRRPANALAEAVWLVMACGTSQWLFVCSQGGPNGAGPGTGAVRLWGMLAPVISGNDVPARAGRRGLLRWTTPDGLDSASTHGPQPWRTGTTGT